MKRDAEMKDQVETLQEKRPESDEDEDDDTDVSMVNVDFEFFDFNTKVDFHALNTLAKQLIGPDAIDFELGALADLILENPIGSTVKVDGEESDPYAFLTVLNIRKHESHAQIKLIVEYLLSKSKKDESCHKLMTKLCSRDAKLSTGLLLSERLINMPVEVCPPLYRILQDELATKSASGTDYAFDYYLLWSKSYTETISKLDEEDDRPKKKGKVAKANKEVFYFHAEDEILIKHAAHRVQFQYSHELPESDSKRAFHDFGIKPTGELIVLSKAQLTKAIAELQDAFPF